MSVLAQAPGAAALTVPSEGGAGATVVAEAAERARALSLEEVLERAELQVRLDRKYLLTADAFARLSRALEPELDVLEIEGRRAFAYESQYFDTPGLQTYHEHLQRRPDRFKIRTRSYLDSAQSMFEVKLADPRGTTTKLRLEQPFATRRRITGAAWDHLSLALRRAGRRAPERLEAACATAYQRTTFVARDGSTRLTCDHDLVVSDQKRVKQGLVDHVLVEVKSGEQISFVDRALAALGVEPVSVSKYCVGVALLRPELPSWPWDELLDRYFDRAAAAAVA